MQDGNPSVREISLRPIGVIRTPYGEDWEPDQPVERAPDKDLDAKPDANVGWIEDLEDREHLLLHIRGIAHDR